MRRYSVEEILVKVRFLIFLPLAVLSSMNCFSSPARDTISVEFSSLAKVLPWHETPGSFNSGGLQIFSCRERITSCERWLDILVKLDGEENSPERTLLRASAIRDRQFDSPLATTEKKVAGSHALVSIDMRRLGEEKARLRLEWTDEKGTILGTSETWISAEPPGRLPAETKIPLTIDIPRGIESVENYPVRFGVPLPRGAAWDIKGLRLVDSSGREVPSQVETAGRWAAEGSIKWVLADALVSGKNGDRIYMMPGERSAASIPSPGVTVTRQGRGEILEIDTGSARYTVAPEGSLIKEALFNGQVVAREGNGRGLYLIDQDGRLARASGREAVMKIEASGPISAVVRIEGFYSTAGGENLARHITRLHFYAGRPEVSAVHTLILIRDTNQVWFREVGWEFDTPAGGGAKALFSLASGKGDDVQSIPLAQKDKVNILQKEGINLGLKPVSFSQWKKAAPSTPWTPCLHGKSVFEISRTGKQKATYQGNMGDWAAVAGRNGGWIISCRDAAAQHPKEFELSAGRVNLKLFSPSSGRELDFRMESIMKNWGMLPIENIEGYDQVPGKVLQDYLDFIKNHKSNAAGWAKTHDILLMPFSSSLDTSVTAGLHSKQVFLHVSSKWMRKTEVMGQIHPKDEKKYPAEEAVIDGLFRGLVKMWNGGPFGGFVDYHAGPNRIVHNYRTGGYSLRAESWYLYGRSAEREIREFAQGSNRAFMDNNMAHWNVEDKIQGLFLRSNASKGTLAGRNRISDLPMHWQGIGDQYELSTVVNMDQVLHDYYITGYRRSADILTNFSDAAKKTLTSEKVHWRALLTMRHIAQAYEFTWEPRLRELLYEINEKYVSDPEGDVLLTKRRPYRSTTYKTETDQDSLLLLWDLFRDPLFKEMALAIGQSNWDKASILPPVKGQNRATGFTYYFLWEETGDPSIISGFDYAKRRLVANRLADLSTKDVKMTCTSQIPRFFKGIPLAIDILERAQSENKPASSWIAFKVEKGPARIFLVKPGEKVMGHNLPVSGTETPMKILIRKEGSASVEHLDPRMEDKTPKPAAAGGKVILKPHVVLGNHVWAGHDLNTVTERSNGVTIVNIPKDAPGGTYELVINEVGDYSVFPDSYSPMALYAPEGWIPPRMIPPVPVYFSAGKNGETGRIFFEKGAKLYMPGMKPFRDGETVTGWTEIPGESGGVWCFESVEPGLVKTENLPGFFSMGDPALYTGENK